MKPVRLSPSLRLLPLLVAAMALSSACARIPRPEGMAVARAVVDLGEVPDSAPVLLGDPGPFDRFREKAFEGYGAGRYPAAASGGVQGRTFARAEARRAALRALAREVLNFSENGEPVLLEILGDTDDWEAKLEQSLERRARVDFRTRNDAELARARIQGAQILQGETPGERPGVDPSADDSLESLARRANAEKLATDAAREILHAELLPYGARRGLLGLGRLASDTFSSALREDLATIQPVGVEFTPDGQCIVEMHYDREDLRRLPR
jgi:hypothetical protein